MRSIATPPSRWQLSHPSLFVALWAVLWSLDLPQGKFCPKGLRQPRAQQGRTERHSCVQMPGSESIKEIFSPPLLAGLGLLLPGTFPPGPNGIDWLMKLSGIVFTDLYVHQRKGEAVSLSASKPSFSCMHKIPINGSKSRPGFDEKTTSNLSLILNSCKLPAGAPAHQATPPPARQLHLNTGEDTGKPVPCGHPWWAPAFPAFPGHTWAPTR